MANIELDGGNKKITVDSGDLTLDIPGDIILDADGANVTFKDGGTAILDISNSSSDAVITASVQDKDIIFKGDDGGSAITALTLDMSDAGKATFNDGIVANNTFLLSGTTPTLTIGDAGAEDTKIVFDGNAQDFYIGLDDSADDLLIGLGSTVGTTPAISIDENLVTTFSGDVSLSNDTAGNILTLEHTGGSNTGNTYVEWKTGGASSGILGKTSGSDERFEIWNKSNDYMTFGTNNSERIRIIAGGQVGVGTTSPGSARMNVQQNANELYYGKNDSSGQFSVTSAGVISATNTTVQSISDERLKKDIADFSGGLNIVKAMKPKTYKWKNPQYHNDKDDTQYGFVAQELLTISNAEKMNMVIVDDANTMMYENEKDLLTDGKAHISGYQEKDAIYVSAVKELSAKVDTLETENTALKARVKTLEDA